MMVARDEGDPRQQAGRGAPWKYQDELIIMVGDDRVEGGSEKV